LPVADLLDTGSVNMALPGTIGLRDTGRRVMGWVSATWAADGFWPPTTGVNGDRAAVVAGPDLPGWRCVAPTRDSIRCSPPPTPIRTAS
jgi:hypothetical protein